MNRADLDLLESNDFDEAPTMFGLVVIGVLLCSFWFAAGLGLGYFLWGAL